MPLSCVAYGCTNRQKSGHSQDGTEPKRTFHRFPMKDSELRAEWEHAVRRKNADGTQWHASKWSVLCSDHFLPDDFSQLPGYIHKRLKDGIVPSVFKAYPPRLQRIVKMHSVRYKKEYDKRMQAKMKEIAEEARLTALLAAPVNKNTKPLKSAEATPVIREHYDHNYFMFRPGVSLERITVQGEDEAAATIASLKKQISKLQDQLSQRGKATQQLKQTIEEMKLSQSNSNVFSSEIEAVVELECNEVLDSELLLSPL